MASLGDGGDRVVTLARGMHDLDAVRNRLVGFRPCLALEHRGDRWV
jgi:hypothetical protein